MKHFLLLVALLGLLWGGCGPKPVVEPVCNGSCTVISGRFTTDGRKKGLADVPLELKWEDSQGIFATVHRKATARTDANGNYALRFNISDDEWQKGVYEIYYAVNANDYVVAHDQLGFAVLGNGLKRDTVVTSDWLLPRKAYLHLEVSGPARISEYFTAEYSFELGPHFGPGRFNYGIIQDLYSSTAPAPTAADVEIAANQPVELAVYRTKMGQLTIQRDTIQLAPGAHYTQRITY